MKIGQELVRACKQAGLSVIEMDSWENTYETDGSFEPIGVILHHDAMGLHNMNVPNNMRKNGVGGSQLWIRYDGVIVFMASGRKWHAGTGIGWNDIQRDRGNTMAIGIETDYSGYGAWPDALLKSINTLGQVLRRTYGFKTTNFCGHREYTRDTGRKIDPSNFDLDAWRAQLDGATIVVSPSHGDTDNPPVEEDWLDMASKDDVKAALRELIVGDADVQAALGKAVVNYHGLNNDGNPDHNSNIGSEIPDMHKTLRAILAKL